MQLEAIHAAMKCFNRHAAPGSECNAWQDFVADTYERLGHAPWASAHAEDETPEDFAAYWISVSNGANDDYDAESGARISDA